MIPFWAKRLESQTFEFLAYLKLKIKVTVKKVSLIEKEPHSSKIH